MSIICCISTSRCEWRHERRNMRNSNRLSITDWYFWICVVVHIHYEIHLYREVDVGALWVGLLIFMSSGNCPRYDFQAMDRVVHLLRAFNRNWNLLFSAVSYVTVEVDVCLLIPLHSKYTDWEGKSCEDTGNTTSLPLDIFSTRYKPITPLE